MWWAFSRTDVRVDGRKERAARFLGGSPVWCFCVLCVLPVAEDDTQVSAREFCEDFVLFVCFYAVDDSGGDVGGEGGGGGDDGVVGDGGGDGGGGDGGDDVGGGADTVECADGDTIAGIGVVSTVGFVLVVGGVVDEAVDEIVEGFGVVDDVHYAVSFLMLFSFGTDNIRRFMGLDCCDNGYSYHHHNLYSYVMDLWGRVWFIVSRYFGRLNRIYYLLSDIEVKEKGNRQ